MAITEPGQWWSARDQGRPASWFKQTHICTRDWFYEEFASNWAITWWWLVGSWLGRQSVQNNGEEDQAALTTMFIFCRGNLWLKLWWNCDNKPRRILNLFTENGSFHSVTYAKTNIGIANPHGAAITQLEPLDLRSTQLLKFQYMPFLDSRRQETAKTSRNAAMNKQWMAKLMRVLLGRDPNHKFMDKFYLYQSMQWQSNTDPASSLKDWTPRTAPVIRLHQQCPCAMQQVTSRFEEIPPTISQHLTSKYF